MFNCSIQFYIWLFCHFYFLFNTFSISLKLDKISAVFFWNNTNTQIRLKATIKKTSGNFNKEYFKSRDKNKNALAISSQQSKLIDSFETVKENYNKSLLNDDLQKCPDYWGGFSFKPYYFEFWQGDNSRLNKRDAYEIVKEEWVHHLLQP